MVVDVIDAAVHDALDDAGRSLDDVAAVGVGSPGVVIDGTVGGASNVPGFLERFSLADLLGESSGRPVRVTNDVTAAAVGEHRLGAGRGTDDLLCIFVGHRRRRRARPRRRAVRGRAGGAGEFGHIVVRQGGAVCPCGRRGCVEAYAGRRAMTLAAERALAAGTPTDPVRRDAREGQAARDVGGLRARRSSAATTLVADLLDDAVSRRSVPASRSAVNLLDVDLVVLGGGIADKLGEELRHADRRGHASACCSSSRRGSARRGRTR